MSVLLVPTCSICLHRKNILSSSWPLALDTRTNGQDDRINSLFNTTVYIAETSCCYTLNTVLLDSRLLLPLQMRKIKGNAFRVNNTPLRQDKTSISWQLLSWAFVCLQCKMIAKRIYVIRCVRDSCKVEQRQY
jgi:hypothetical protein